MCFISCIVAFFLHSVQFIKSAAHKSLTGLQQAGGAALYLDSLLSFLVCIEFLEALMDDSHFTLLDFFYQ